MSSPGEKLGGDVTPAAADGFTYPEEALVDGDSDPNTSRVDPDDYTTSKQLKEQAEEGKTESGKDAHNLKSAIIISGVVVAVIGAIFAIARKIREA